MSFLGLIVYVPSLILDFCLTLISSLKWFNRIDDRVVLGGLPFTRYIKQLLGDENIKTVVSMNEDFELWIVNRKKEWETLGIEFLQLPTSDIFKTIDQEKLREGVDFICQHIVKSNNNKLEPQPSVYVHCKSGKTRSATLVGCYLMKRYGWSPEKAVNYIRLKRPQILLHTRQWEALETFHEYLCSTSSSEIRKIVKSSETFR